MSVKEVENISLEFFYKQNKQEDKQVQYIASTSFVDGDGKPVPWTLRPVTADEEANIRKMCTERHTDKRTGVIQEIMDDQNYTVGLTAQGVVFPDLYDKNLQQTYGVLDATSLLKAMLNAGELQSLALKVIEVSGLDDIESLKNENELKAELIKNN